MGLRRLPGGFPSDAGQLILAFERSDLGLYPQLNVRRILNTAYEVLRHRGRESLGSHQQVNPATGTGQEDRRLTRGVPAADNDGFACAAAPRLRAGGGIVDSGAQEA